MFSYLLKVKLYFYVHHTEIRLRVLDFIFTTESFVFTTMMPSEVFE